MRSSRLFFAVFIFLVVSTSLSSLEVRDVIRTSGGVLVSGRIVERYPGVEYHIETENGLQIIPCDQVEWIEKKVPDSGKNNFVYTDIVYLHSGLLLHGTIVEEYKEDKLTILSQNGAAVSIPMVWIWRVTHEKRAAIIPPRGIGKNTRVQGLRREFKIEVAAERLKSEEAEDSGGQDTEELNQLREELEALEEENSTAALEDGKDEEFLDRILDDIKNADTAADESITELARRAAACAAENPDALSKIAELYEFTASGISDVAVLADALNDIDPGIVREIRKVEEEEDLAELTVLMDGNFWNSSSAERIEDLAAQVPYEDREDLYRESRMKAPLNAAISNALIPFGAGSMSQGDKLGVFIQAGSILLGGLLVLDSYAASQAAGGAFELDLIGWIGTGIGAAGYGYSVARPFIFASQKNDLARRVLILEGNTNEE